jgi:UDP-glucuronate 4-epimerase
MNKHLIIKDQKYFDIFNIASGRKGNIKKILELLELNLNKKAKINYISRQKGDMIGTRGNTKKLKKFINKIPKTTYENGIRLFVKWFIKYYKEK